MNFYVPDPQLDAQADMLLLLMEEFLAGHGRAFTGRRIRALIWDDGGEEETILVGAEYRDCEAGEDPVLLISHYRRLAASASRAAGRFWQT